MLVPRISQYKRNLIKNISQYFAFNNKRANLSTPARGHLTTQVQTQAHQSVLWIYQYMYTQTLK